MEPILHNWEEFARSLGAVTSAMDAAALRDHAELILLAVADDLDTQQSPAQQEAKSKGESPPRFDHLPPSAATSHGTERAKEGFSLEQMVSEYRALRASVLRLWAKEEAASPKPLATSDLYEQQIRFNEAMDEALADSIKTFSYALDQMAVNKARRRMEALGAFSAGLGHDLANVLLPMRISLTALDDQRLTPGTDPLVDALRQAVEHLGGLSNGLRALSMDPDNAAASPYSTVLHDWWRSAISPFTWVLPKGVRLHAAGLNSADAPLPPVRAPAHVLMQAVFNLVQNAAQALGQHNAERPDVEPTGNIWVTAGLMPGTCGSSSAGAADMVYLTVRDDGPGMDAHTAARCTEPFFTTKTHDRGAGLGLFLVHSIVERHNGKLIIESKVGEGASFTLLLPIDSADTSVTPAPTSPDLARSE